MTDPQFDIVYEPPTLLTLADEVIEWRCWFAALHESANGHDSDQSQCGVMSAVGGS
jgi:hypothetical protein